MPRRKDSSRTACSELECNGLNGMVEGGEASMVMKIVCVMCVPIACRNILTRKYDKQAPGALLSRGARWKMSAKLLTGEPTRRSPTKKPRE